MPPVRPGPCRPRSSAATPSGIGTAATPARGDRVPTPPSPVSRLRPLHVRLAARGRSYCGQGPRLQAVLALMTGAYRMSKRMAETFCADVLGVPVCAGQICASEAATAAATEPVVQELREYVQSQPANVDETGWWQRRQRGWLWTVVTQAVTVFTITLSRAGSVARGLIDPSGGQVITTDRYKGYVWLPLRQRQICWAHLSRDFQAMVDRANAGSQSGEE